MTDFRALCEELVDVLADHCGDNEFAWGLVDRAGAALAEQTPSLKEQALITLEDIPNIDSAHYNIIQRALEQLND
jgi:hypothetical protein